MRLGIKWVENFQNQKKYQGVADQVSDVRLFFYFILSYFLNFSFFNSV